MAKKREPVKPVEPESESDEASSEEVEASESESEQTAAQTKSKPQQATPPPQQQPASSSEEEEESGSESESESDVPESNVVKPLTLSNGSKKTASKTKVPDPEPPIPTKASSSAKRLAQEDSATATKDSKKKKTAEPEPEPEIAEKKSNLFQRLWTEDDEIAILKGMRDYANKKKSDPMSDLNSFHDFIKKDLHADFTKTQLQDKIRRLKKKFGNNNGKKRVLSKPHEQVAYDLSNMIWGKENGSAVSKGTKMNAVKNTLFGTEKVNLGSGIGSGEEHMLATGRWLFESGRGLEGESEWNDLRMEDLKLFQRRLEISLEQTKLVMDVMNRGDQ